MEFGALSPTVDVFEVLIVVALAIGLPLALWNVRAAWDEKEWAIDDPDPAQRRLGENRWENAQDSLGAMILVAVCVFSSMMVPSPLQLLSPGVADFQDQLNAVLQRIGFLFIVIFLTRKCARDAVWRRYVDRQRLLVPHPDPAESAAKAVELGQRVESAVAENINLTTDVRDRVEQLASTTEGKD